MEEIKVIIKLDKMLAKRRWTKYKLCQESGLNHQAITKLERNMTKSISFDTLGKICKALECTPSDIIEIEY